MTQIQIDANNWIDSIVKERGLKQAKQMLTYNVNHNPHFNHCYKWVSFAWERIDRLTPIVIC